jgi:hypothetical protein
VAKQLLPTFSIQEEWVYVDSESHLERTLDIMADRYLADLNPPLAIVPNLTLLIECKKSDLPVLFFLSSNTLRFPDFPRLLGLPHSTLLLMGKKASYSFSVISSLGLSHHEFVKDVPTSRSISKLERHPKKSTLSGDMPYNEIILPISKAVQHFEKTAWFKPDHPSRKLLRQFFCHLTIPVVVLDASMIGVRVTDTKTSLIQLPWVRVLRDEIDHIKTIPDLRKLLAVDIVHKDFLETYLSKHLLPFANSFSKLVLTHQDVLIVGKGRVNDDFAQRILEPHREVPVDRFLFPENYEPRL